MYGVVAIELAASIAPAIAAGASLGTLAWLSEMKLALWPGVRGAGVPVTGAGVPVVLAICSEIAARLSLRASSRDSSVSIAARRSAWADFNSAKRASASARAAATSFSLAAI